LKHLFQFRHGLGDACQFSIVLRHLKHYHPEWEIGVEAWQGIHTCFNGLADYFPIRHPMFWREHWPKPQHVNFSRPERGYANAPSTKVTRCLLEEFGVDPIEDLYKYEITPTPEAIAKAERYHNEELHGEPFAVLHYKGTSSPEKKDLNDWEAICLCAGLISQGLKVLLLDWNANKLHNGESILNPDKRHPWLWDGERVGEAGTIHQLIARASLFIGIDSGPAHLAGATTTPSYVFWWGHHPCHCFDPCDNVTHLVPDWLEEEQLAVSPVAHEYFLKHYRHEKYGENLTDFVERFAAELIRPEENEAGTS
jgi:hypothetical protein